MQPDLVWYPDGDGPPVGGSPQAPEEPADGPTGPGADPRRPGAVVDAKYKAERASGFPNADLYQMLAYCTALGLRDGHLARVGPGILADKHNPERFLDRDGPGHGHAGGIDTRQFRDRGPRHRPSGPADSVCVTRSGGPREEPPHLPGVRARRVLQPPQCSRTDAASPRDADHR